MRLYFIWLGRALKLIWNLSSAALVQPVITTKCTIYIIARITLALQPAITFLLHCFPHIFNAVSKGTKINQFKEETNLIINIISNLNKESNEYPLERNSSVMNLFAKWSSLSLMPIFELKIHSFFFFFHRHNFKDEYHQLQA